MRTVHATRYVTPLREGGSLPAVIEADDEGLYVLKFRGAGQGCKALIAELVCGEIARVLGLPMPEIVFVQLDAELARTEPDAEIQDLIRRSAGLNLALDYLPGSVAFDPLAHRIDAALASRIVWFDAFVTNVDRTPRNVNLLMWHRKPWLIDHGAALIVQHQWEGWQQRVASPFAMVKDHVLLSAASQLPAADAECAQRLTPAEIERIVGLIPESWLEETAVFATRDAQRAAYAAYLLQRLQAPRAFVEEAERARAVHL
jgi:hypothetical protein